MNAAQPMPEHLTYATKAVGAIILMGITWIADITASNIEDIPKVISELGLPMTFLGLTIYALIYTTKALRASEAGRLKDRAEYTQGIREDAAKAEVSRERIREAMDRQANAFDRVADRIDDLIDIHKKP